MRGPWVNHYTTLRHTTPHYTFRKENKYKGYPIMYNFTITSKNTEASIDTEHGFLPFPQPLVFWCLLRRGMAVEHKRIVVRRRTSPKVCSVMASALHLVQVSDQYLLIHDCPVSVEFLVCFGANDAVWCVCGCRRSARARENMRYERGQKDNRQILERRVPPRTHFLKI